MASQRVLVTGAAGRIGAAFVSAHAQHYQFRLADRVLPPGAEHDPRWMRLDITDAVACEAACVDIDTVLHLAGDASTLADFQSSLLDNNIVGTYNIFTAAAKQRCQRVIFASSIQTVAGYPFTKQVQPESPHRPVTMYGVSKCFGEAVASYFAATHDLSCIVIRIGNYAETPPASTLSAHGLSSYLSVRDCHQLFRRCIETPNIPFAVVHGLSANRFPRLNLDETTALLGYVPQDDSFAFLQLHDNDPW